MGTSARQRILAIGLTSIAVFCLPAIAQAGIEKPALLKPDRELVKQLRSAYKPGTQPKVAVRPPAPFGLASRAAKERVMPATNSPTKSATREQLWTLPHHANSDLPSSFALDPAFTYDGSYSENVALYNKFWNEKATPYNQKYDAFWEGLGYGTWTWDRTVNRENETLNDCFKALVDYSDTALTPASGQFDFRHTLMSKYAKSFECAEGKIASAASGISNRTLLAFACNQANSGPTAFGWESGKQELVGQFLKFDEFVPALQELARRWIGLEDAVYTVDPDMFTIVGYTSNTAYWNDYFNYIRPALENQIVQFGDWLRETRKIATQYLVFCDESGLYRSNGTQTADQTPELSLGVSRTAAAATHAGGDTSQTFRMTGSWSNEPSGMYENCPNVPLGVPNPRAKWADSELKIVAERAVCGQQALRTRIGQIAVNQAEVGSFDARARQVAEDTLCVTFETSPETVRLAAVMSQLDWAVNRQELYGAELTRWSQFAYEEPTTDWAADTSAFMAGGEHALELDTEASEINRLLDSWHVDPCSYGQRHNAITARSLFDIAVVSGFGRERDLAHERSAAMLLGFWSDEPLSRFETPVSTNVTSQLASKKFALPLADQQQRCAVQEDVLLNFEPNQTIGAYPSTSNHLAEIYNNAVSAVIGCLRSKVLEQYKPNSTEALPGSPYKKAFAQFCRKVQSSSVVQAFVAYSSMVNSARASSYMQNRERQARELVNAANAAAAVQRALPLNTVFPVAMLTSVSAWNTEDVAVRERTVPLESDLADGRICAHYQ